MDCIRKVGRPSIAPERLLRALLLQVFYSVRSERLLMEQLDYNLLFRWFVGLEIDDAVWNHAVFSKNRDRLLNQDLAQKFFAQRKAAGGGADVGRALHGGWHADRGLGGAEELSPQGRRRVGERNGRSCERSQRIHRRTSPLGIALGRRCKIIITNDLDAGSRS